MEILNRQFQRLIFHWQRSPVGNKWVAAILVMALILLVLIGHAYFRKQQLQSALQLIPITSASVRKSAKPVEDSSYTKLQNWPLDEEADGISAEILSLADAMDMIFERAEFQSVPVENSILLIQRIKLPLKGDYPQVRKFLTQVLQRYPSLALSQFKLQRNDVMQNQVEAYIEFSLYTRKKAQT